MGNNRLRLTVGMYSYLDRTRALQTGEVVVDGVDLTFETLDITELFRRVAQHAEFDVAEMSAATYMTMLGKGDHRLIGVPVFLSRAFRHNMIFVNSASGIKRPEDLRGKTVGLHEYQMTAALWVRAFLEDDYGVEPSSIRWLCGGSEAPEERYAHPAPPGVTIERVPPTRSLAGMFEQGDIDAVLTFEPNRYREAEPEIRRLFPDFRSVEKEYFRRTGYFPIMHLLVIRRTLYHEYPWLGHALLRAFEQAKNSALDRLRDFNALAVMLPWLEDEMYEIDAAFGGDPFPYGIDKNAATLEALTSYAYRQGLTPRHLSLSEMFAL